MKSFPLLLVHVYYDLLLVVVLFLQEERKKKDRKEAELKCAISRLSNEGG